MAMHRFDRRASKSVVWRGLPYVATALIVAVVGGLWLRLAAGRGWQVLLPLAILALPVVFGVIRQVRARAALRLHAALDAYAAQEIARRRERLLQRRLQLLSARAGSFGHSRISQTFRP